MRENLNRYTLDEIEGWLKPDASGQKGKVAALRPRRKAGGDRGIKAYVRRTLEQEAERVRAAPEGTRNATLNRAAFCLGTLVGAGALPREEAEAALTAAALEAGLEEGEIGATLASGLEAGSKEPRDLGQIGAEVRDLRGRRVIRVINGELPAMVDQAEAALLERGERIYQRGGVLVRRVRQGAVTARGIGRPGRAVLLLVERVWLQEQLTVAAQWLRYDARIEEWRPTNAPRLVAETYLSRAGTWQAPSLVGIIEAPTLRLDGSILDQPGYDPATGLLFDPGNVDFGRIPAQPTRGEAEAALETLQVLLQGFPFEQAHDRSIALGALLTALVRRLLPAAPLILIEAPVPGSGKTLLADTIARVASGHPVAVVSQASDPAEERKRYLGLFMEGELVLCIDNIEQPLGGDTLCSILTQEVWKERLLGTNTTVAVPTNALLLATGNNVQVVGDLTRRVLPCRLDPRTERPQERRFEINLPEHVAAHRAELVRAGLTLLRAYHVAGRPKPAESRPFGSFEAWSDLIRGALLWLGLPDPLDAQRRLDEADPVQLVLSQMLSAWHELLGDEAITVKDAISRAQGSEAGSRELLEAMEATGRHERLHGVVRINPRALGKWLTRHKGRVHGGLRFEHAGEHKRAALWRVARV